MCVYVCVSIANFVKYLKNALLALLGQRTITRTGSYLLLQQRVTALFSCPYTFTFSCLYLSDCLSICLSVCVCLSVCLSACLSVCLSMCQSVYVSLCLSVCARVCLYVFMYYVYMYVVFIVIIVCKLLHVRRPTSSPKDCLESL